MTKKRSVILLLFASLLLLLTAALSQTSAKSENQQFEDYTKQFFRQEVSGNTISLHYMLKNPTDYGIRKIPVTYGHCSTDTKAATASIQQSLEQLRSYDRANLSKENQLTYDVMEDSLTLSLAQAPYLLYDEPLTPLTGTQSQLPVLLSEYQFHTENDVKTYLNLLTKTPDYFSSIINFEKAKAQSGLFMPAYCADAIIEECKAFIDMGADNYLISSFQNRLAPLPLSKQQADHYREENSNCISNYVIPAYQNLLTALESLKDSGKNSDGLAHLPNGKNFYETLVAAETGSHRSIPQLQELTKRQMADDLSCLQTALTTCRKDPLASSSSSAPLSDQTSLPDFDEPAEILSTLSQKMKNAFPKPPDVTTNIKYVQKSMEEYLSPAFYMIPSIDNTKNNTIYINKGHLPDGLSLFTTLAHEGYPGHLYQTTYYASQNPSPVRSLLNYGGYTEGWATYTEMISYYYTPLPKNQATILQKNSSLMLGLYALADMGIHYDGWTFAKTVAFFRQYGIQDTDTIQDIHTLIIGDPGNYLKYYIGYVEFLELKKDAVENWGDKFSQKRFHKAVLDIGPASFDVIRKHLGRSFLQKTPSQMFLSFFNIFPQPAPYWLQAQPKTQTVLRPAYIWSW